MSVSPVTTTHVSRVFFFDGSSSRSLNLLINSTVGKQKHQVGVGGDCEIIGHKLKSKGKVTINTQEAKAKTSQTFCASYHGTVFSLMGAEHVIVKACFIGI